MSWHPNPEINRQRQENYRDWQRERARDGGGFAFPPCGCVWVVLFLVVTCVGCIMFSERISEQCTPEMSTGECAKAVMRSLDAPF